MSRSLSPLAALLLAACPALAVARSAKDPPPRTGIRGAEKVRVPFYDEKTGKRRALLLADTVTPDAENSQILNAVRLRILVYQSQGRLTVITGDTGKINTTAKTAYLKGHVVIVVDDSPKVEDRTRVYTDDLHWTGNASMATTEGPCKIVRADVTTTGVGMECLREAGPEPKEGERDTRGRLVVRHNVKSVIRPDKAGWLNGTQTHQAPPKGATPKPDSRPRPAPPKDATPKPQKTQRPAPPITITCRGPHTVDRSAGSAVYLNDVRAVQDAQTLLCDKLTVYFQSKGESKSQAALEKIHAEGHVKLDNGTTVAFAEVSVLERNVGEGVDTLHLYGRPAEVRWDNGNVLVGGHIRQIKRGGASETVDSSPTKQYPRNGHLYIQPARPAPPATEQQPKAPAKPESPAQPAPPPPPKAP